MVTISSFEHSRPLNEQTVFAALRDLGLRVSDYPAALRGLLRVPYSLQET